MRFSALHEADEVIGYMGGQWTTEDMSTVRLVPACAGYSLHDYQLEVR